MPSLTRQQLGLLIALTLLWGINWPIMKAGITGFPPLTFRALSIWFGLPVLALGLIVMKVPFAVPRARWAELLWLTVGNLLVWQVLIILALTQLSSGRTAILGYTMPIFSAVIGALWFGDTLKLRGWLGVAAAALGVLLLLWYELANMAGRPIGVLLALTGAAVWALGTRQLRISTIGLPTMTIAFWMVALTGVVIAVLAVVFERDQWHTPGPANLFAIGYNAVLIFGIAQTAWLLLARGLPPLASTLSVMFIPVLGVFSGAWWLNETLHWQDWAAVSLMVVAIASVLLPTRSPVELKTL
ncbi:MAG: DMT family transporter [Burkholderiaceae bacterium]